MPAEVFGPNFSFLPREEILTFEEIVRLVQIAVPMGIRKVRLTGGEPLLRRGISDLVGTLAAVADVEDLAITTNGILLPHHAEELCAAGLSRVTVSLDALNPDTFAKMNGVGGKVSRVLAGINAALTHGLPVKLNAVIQRGINDDEILPLVRWSRDRGLTIRFIEFMDVGETNGWRMDRVVSAQEIREIIESEFALHPIPPGHPGEVAERYQFGDGSGEIGIIASVTRPFCQSCNRLRVSAEGRLFTCLFAQQGHDLRSLLRSGASDDEVRNYLTPLWMAREDRYSELRGSTRQQKQEMSYLGG